MIEKVKKFVLHLLCALVLLGGMTACEGLEVNWDNGNGTSNGNETGNETGNGNGADNGNGDVEEVAPLIGCWHLVSLYGANVDADIYIDFGKDGKFVIYQRTEELTFTIFNGTYIVDEENSVVSGVYDDGTQWLSSYNYVVDEEIKTLTLTSVENPLEVAVYEMSEVPTSATTKTRGASVRDVKPL